MDDEHEKIKKYYTASIAKMLDECNDIELLELILKILQKSKLTL